MSDDIMSEDILHRIAELLGSRRAVVMLSRDHDTLADARDEIVRLRFWLDEAHARLHAELGAFEKLRSEVIWKDDDDGVMVQVEANQGIGWDTPLYRKASTA